MPATLESTSSPSTGPASASRLNADQLQLVKERMAEGAEMDDLARELDFATSEEVLPAVAAALGLGVADLTQLEIDLTILEGFPIKLIHRYELFPIGRMGDELVLAISNPFDLHPIDAVSSTMGLRVTPVLVPRAELTRLIKSRLGVGAQTIGDLIARQRDQCGVEVLDDLAFDGSEDAEQAQEASVVRLVNEILSEAIDARASDIHVEAQESGIKLRYRIDGVLQRQPTPPEMNRFQAAIISRLKIMAKLNIAERRVPQDGRIQLRIQGREVDVRVSIIPMLFGEGIVMRLLDKSNLSFSLQGVGMPDDTYAQFLKLIQLPHGIVLVTGPTGSGKTTTLYSALNEIKSEEIKIITTEDPIEYQLDGINQIQVHAKVGLTFAAGLRSILRHDPDVVLVGEVRDLETAENAIQASLTGHLVFSTLHTNDSSGTFTRLCDMGVEPFLVSSTIEGVLAQRLVRRLCPECRVLHDAPPEDMPDDFPWEALNGGASIYRPVGCRMCRHTGYAGRIGIYELLVANPHIRQLANERCTSTDIKRAALGSGMRSLRQSGWDKALQGITSVSEVLRVTKADEEVASLQSE